jgi:hypothetical protein
MGLSQKKQKPEYVTLTCKQCGGSFERKTAFLNSLSKRFCGSLCASRYRKGQKSSKPRAKRHKPTARQRGAITSKVRKQLKLRSGGRCEMCGGEAVHAAHIKRRWKHDTPPTVEELLHLCVPCHRYCDETEEGRAYLKAIEESKLG